MEICVENLYVDLGASKVLFIANNMRKELNVSEEYTLND